MYFPILLLLLNYFHVDWLHLLLPPSVWSSVDVLDYHQHQVSPWHSNLYWSRVNCDHTTSSSIKLHIYKTTCLLSQAITVLHQTSYKLNRASDLDENSHLMKSTGSRRVFKTQNPSDNFSCRYMTLDVLAISINFTTWVIPD